MLFVCLYIRQCLPSLVISQVRNYDIFLDFYLSKYNILIGSLILPPTGWFSVCVLPIFWPILGGLSFWQTFKRLKCTTLKLTHSQLQPTLNNSKCYCKNGDPETNSGFTVILKFSFPMPSGIKQPSHCTKYLVITW